MIATQSSFDLTRLGGMVKIRYSAYAFKSKIGF